MRINPCSFWNIQNINSRKQKNVLRNAFPVPCPIGAKNTIWNTCSLRTHMRNVFLSVFRANKVVEWFDSIPTSIVPIVYFYKRSLRYYLWLILPLFLPVGHIHAFASSIFFEAHWVDSFMRNFLAQSGSYSPWRPVKRWNLLRWHGLLSRPLYSSTRPSR